MSKPASSSHADDGNASVTSKHQFMSDFSVLMVSRVRLVLSKNEKRHVEKCDRTDRDILHTLENKRVSTQGR